MASEKQIAANRRNALKSTGPRTEAGRARSRMNALKHGLSRTLPAAEAPDPRVLPLARALVGEGVTDALALAAAEEVALESLTLIAVRALRASLMGGKEPTGERVCDREPETRAGSDVVPDLMQLERFERQALARRRRALHRLDGLLADVRDSIANGK